jgi:polyhydroxybutyrate depolymerase
MRMLPRINEQSIPRLSQNQNEDRFNSLTRACVMEVTKPSFVRTCFLCVILFAAHAHANAPAGHESRTLTHAGVTRSYVLHVPAQIDRANAAKPVALVLMLHGYGGTAVNAIRETGWSAKASREGFIVAYPQATRSDERAPAHFRNNPPAWNGGSGQFHAGAANVDDVGFIRALIGGLQKELPIDRERVFVTGFSNGASMTYRIGHALSDVVTAIAPVAGASSVHLLAPDFAPAPARKISMLYVTGANDPLNPLEGGPQRMSAHEKSGQAPARLPVATQIKQWASALGLPPTPSADETVNGVRRQTFGEPKRTPRIETITVEGLGHIWAGGENLLPEFLVGKPTAKLNATDTIWSFFISIRS